MKVRLHSNIDAVDMTYNLILSKDDGAVQQLAAQFNLDELSVSDIVLLDRVQAKLNKALESMWH